MGRTAEAILHARHRSVKEAMELKSPSHSPSSTMGSTFYPPSGPSSPPPTITGFFPKSASAPGLSGEGQQQLQPFSASSPVYPSLAYLDRDPPEFAVQKHMEAQRQARKILRMTYRGTIEGLVPDAFANRFEYPPRIIKAEGPTRLQIDGGGDGGSTWEQAPVPRKVYARQPLPIARRAAQDSKTSPAQRALPAPGGGASSSSAAVSSTRSLALVPPQSTAEEKVETDAEFWARRRKESLQEMREFGRMPHGAPYTFSQVRKEVEANLNFREAKDMRALAGGFGPGELGPGSGGARRKLPFGGGGGKDGSTSPQRRGRPASASIPEPHLAANSLGQTRSVPVPLALTDS